MDKCNFCEGNGFVEKEYKIKLLCPYCSGGEKASSIENSLSELEKEYMNERKTKATKIINKDGTISYSSEYVEWLEHKIGK
jgi:hypothetical protein